jgi:hypothetical protein
MKYYTYAHYTADTKELFYIGKGTKVKDFKYKRASCYWKRNPYWNNKVKKHGGFTYEILSSWETEKEAFDHEKLLISIFGKKLVNLSEGGEGNSGRVQSEQEKQLRASKLLGSKRTEEAIKNMSAAQKINTEAIATLTKEREKQKKKVRCVETNVVYLSISDAGRSTQISFQNISKVCKYERPKAGGYTWEFIDG